ncbi:hypothetical protein BABINDRAFT_159372 [Babjeviella inositovora NRRL Y-12698]|uniref:Cation efflux protein transmembrane domain-containing protein n=1 Tax=Babjeviella inositovora NRRL Y-12698 TaxID=984486 RepID=A0A1E3QZ13_9ASCO|nr:uncharacterized protein BABINDRAFT_159372 [Babjeviella inositovora NRRL Y-12698]ODQ82876.1 hypothetical protein BABINDRAFT_159372 [Babjeviella inositovora NRRL Y-12698]
MSRGTSILSRVSLGLISPRYSALGPRGLRPLHVSTQCWNKPKNENSHSHSQVEHSHLDDHSDTHIGHSHSHGPNELLTNSSRAEIWTNPAVRITWIGLATNVTMAAAKFAGGIAFHSQALIADGIHALSDLVSDVLTLATVTFAKRPLNTRFPDGLGKVEVLGSLGVSLLLLFAGLSIGWSSLVGLVEPLLPHYWVEWVQSVNFGHSHGHVETVTEDVDINAAWIALAFIGVKEWLFRRTLKIGQEMNSKVLVANAWHHRVDSLTSVVAFVTISGAYFFHLGSLDLVGGLIVSALVVKAGTASLRTSLSELVGEALAESDQRYIQMRTLVETELGKSDFASLGNLVLMPSGANLSARVSLRMQTPTDNRLVSAEDLIRVSEGVKRIVEQQEKGKVKTVSVDFSK